MTTDPEIRDELRANVRRWVEREVLPVAGDLEHEDTYPADLVAQMQAMGLFGMAAALSVVLIAAHARPFSGQVSVEPRLLQEIVR